MSRGLRLLGAVFVLGSLALLYPGISQPVLTLSGELEKSALADFGIDLLAGEDGNSQAREMLVMMSRFIGLDQVEGRMEAYRSTRSILGMSRELADNGNLLVAVMIVTFSVVIPVLKLLLQLFALAMPGPMSRRLFWASMRRWANGPWLMYSSWRC
jgi:hypothetical protein